MWRLLFPSVVKYLDLPQNFDPAVGGAFYQREMRHLATLILGKEPDAVYEQRLREAIALTNRQQAAFDQLRKRSQEEPHLIPIQEFYHLYRSALVLHPDEHIRLLEGYLAQIGSRPARPLDNIRVMVKGAFCEQPPLGLLRTIERAGCYIVNHDFLTGLHWFTAPLKTTGDPFAALADGFINRTRTAPFKYQGDGDRGQALVDEARELKVDGVLLAAPSFCDPSLLERPMLQDALRAAGIPYTSFKYAENAGQFQAIKEQAGTFSDSVRLWAGEEVHHA